jgi:hypothetical protein
MDRNVLSEQTKMTEDDVAAPHQPERRALLRRIPVPSESLSRVRLRLGAELTVLNVSDSGVLTEGTSRLLPGSRVDVHVTNLHGRTLVRATVARAHVSALLADTLRYRAALTFDQRVDTGPAAG